MARNTLTEQDGAMDSWHICQTARKKGAKEGIRLYQFLKAPLIRCFGEEWYKELDLTAQEWYRYCEERHHEKF